MLAPGNLATPLVSPVRSVAMTVAHHPTTRIDRRLDERQDCLTGLRRWLESARRMLDLDALALADPSGCLVVGAGSAKRCEEMAAIAPLPDCHAEAGTLKISALSSGAAWLCAPKHELPTDDWNAVTGGCLRILGWSDGC
jgi:hypothetical protein